MRTRPSRLTLLRKTSSYVGLYRCECGNEVEVSIYKVKDGHTRSCGCIRKDEQFKVHGLNKHPLQHAFYNIKKRCYNKNNPFYENYGGRGVYVCKEWLDNPILFIEWGLKNGWKPGMVVDKDIKSSAMGLSTPIYSPETCTIITATENANNKRNNVKYEYDGIMQTIPQLARQIGIKHSTLRNRIFKLGWTLNEAMSANKPYGKRIGVTCDHDAR